MTPDERSEAEAEWLRLTREVLPSMATADWPVRFDHCFQRICLDNASGGVWYDAIKRRPAYSHASDPLLTEALRLARGVAEGSEDLRALNDKSLRWRKERKRAKP